MDPEVAKLAVRFLLRVHLTGEEVPAFNAVMAELHRVSEDVPMSDQESASSADGGSTPIPPT